MKLTPIKEGEYVGHGAFAGGKFEHLETAVESLIEALALYTLDPVFEKYGNFMGRCEATGEFRFFGNFFDYSYVFNFTTSDEELGNRFCRAIHAHLETDRFKNAREVREEQDRLQLERYRQPKAKTMARERFEREMGAV